MLAKEIAEPLLRLRYYPDPVLRHVCEPFPVEDFDIKHRRADIQDLLDGMWEVLRYHQGVGLAAPQVGILERVICVHTEHGCKIELINPEIEMMPRKGQFHSREGCLSWPRERVGVMRYRQVKVKGLDRHGDPVTFGGKMMQAAALQHEIEHLDGINLADHV